MKTIQEAKKWLLANRVNEHGRLDLKGLDFSDFDGNVDISYMKVKRSLYQRQHEVEGHLYQGWHEVKGNLWQCSQGVKGNLWQEFQNVKGDLHQGLQEVEGYAHLGGNDFSGIVEFVDWGKRWKIIKEKDEVK